jgi:hypothetical protein
MALNKLKEVTIMKLKFPLFFSIFLFSCASTAPKALEENELIGTWAGTEKFEGQTLYDEESFLPTSMYCSATFDFSSKDVVLKLAEGAWSMRDNELEITIGDTWPENEDSNMGGLRTVVALNQTRFEYEITNILAIKSTRTVDRGDYWCKLLRQLRRK